MRLSVALCTYNGEKYLREQLDSIAGQTLPPDELVVCDDRSTDSTLEILEDFRARAPFPVHIHENEQNLGSNRNFEKAIRLCSGKVVALCDQDDVWKPAKLERLAEALEANPEAGYAFSDADLVDENLRPLGRRLWDVVCFHGGFRDRFLQGGQFLCFTKKPVVTGATMAFRASLGALAMPFPQGRFWVHDRWLAMVGSAVGMPGIPVDEPLVDYRQHSGQQIGARDSSEKFGKTLWAKYQYLKKNRQSLFEEWEGHCLEMIKARGKLEELSRSNPSGRATESLKILLDFERHYRNRKTIIQTRNPVRYWLILRETFSGRYAKFSKSWESVVRDALL